MKHIRTLLYLSAFMVFLSLLMGSAEYAYLATFPLFVIVLGLLFQPPSKIKIERFIEERTYRPGEEFEVLIDLEVGSGLGFILLRQPLPTEIELVEGSNVIAFFKGPLILRKRVKFRVRILKKGRYTIPPVELYTESLLHLGGGSMVVAKPVTVSVLPIVHPPRRLRTPNSRSTIPIPLTSYSLTGPISTDFKEIRDYQPGDPMRLINWKASARMGRILVNEYEREGKKTIMFYVDVRGRMLVGHSIKSPVDYALSLVGSMAYYFLRRGYNVGLYIVGMRELVMPSTGNRQVYAILRKLLEVDAINGTPESFSEAFKRSKRILIQFSPLVVVVSNLVESKEIREGLKAMMKYYREKPPVIIFDINPYSIFNTKSKELVHLRKLAVENELKAFAYVIQWDIINSDLSSVLAKVMGMIK